MSDLDGMPKTEVKVNARLELLRMLVMWRDTLIPLLKKELPDHQPREGVNLGGHTMPPGDDWENEWEDMILAAKELAAIGHITLEGRDKWEPEDWYVTITPAGADHITAHDLIGESAQEAA